MLTGPGYRHHGWAAELVVRERREPRIETPPKRRRPVNDPEVRARQRYMSEHRTETPVNKTAALVISFLIVLLLATGAFLAAFASDKFLARLSAVTSALAPLGALLAVIVAAIGWSAAARAAGEQSRSTEREKREIAYEAHRGLLRARLLRVWGIVDEAVGFIKPYQPNVIEQFTKDAEDVYWDVNTFAAFTAKEQALVRHALDRVRVDNSITMQMLQDETAQAHGSRRSRETVSEAFLTSLDALENVFREVLRDADFADAIRSRYENTHARVAASYERERDALQSRKTYLSDDE